MEMLMLGVDADKSTNAWHRLSHKMMFERKKNLQVKS